MPHILSHKSSLTLSNPSIYPHRSISFGMHSHYELCEACGTRALHSKGLQPRGAFLRGFDCQGGRREASGPLVLHLYTNFFSLMRSQKALSHLSSAKTTQQNGLSHTKILSTFIGFADDLFVVITEMDKGSTALIIQSSDGNGDL